MSSCCQCAPSAQPRSGTAGWVRIAFATVVAAQAMIFSLAVNLSPPTGVTRLWLHGALAASAVILEVLSRLWDNRVPVPHTLFYVVSVVLPYHWRSGLVLAPATILIAGLLAGGRPGVGERRHLHLS